MKNKKLMMCLMSAALLGGPAIVQGPVALACHIDWLTASEEDAKEPNKDEAKPGEGTPAPEEKKPEEAKPGETPKPAEPKPDEKPAEPKPDETKPGDKAPETKPGEEKPGDKPGEKKEDQKPAEEDKDYYEKASRYRKEVMQVLIGAGFRAKDINSAQGTNVTTIYKDLSENKDKGRFIRHLLAIFKYADGSITEFLSYTNKVDLIGKAVNMWDLYQGNGVKIMYYVFKSYHVSDHLAKEWAVYVGDLVDHN